VSIADFDLHMMGIALRLAERGLGNAAPNPAVGAVIADEAGGELIARGWTQAGGRPHAETEAIRRAGSRAEGATLYVTLEPCAHHGATPPCADAIIAAGLRRVAVGIRDPDPRTAGQGIARLEAAGIEVSENVRAREAWWSALGHILRVTEERPFVGVKLALDGAGEAPRGEDGRPRWVTSTTARAHGHLLRARADAIIVGAGTVRDDNPELTCRLPGLGRRSPVRVVMSASLDVPLRSRLVQTARDVPVWVVTGTADPRRRAALEDAGVEVLSLGDGAGQPGVRATLRLLAGRGITRVLVEGGPSIWRAFSATGVVDEAVIHQGAARGHRERGLEGLPALLERWLPGSSLRLAETRRIGEDVAYELRRE
jgi:diaminohydroxyphosphoribosylaminopyrimidine deaminase/5-amino-6-(5-phosphoribosylamino)uracil reductase